MFFNHMLPMKAKPKIGSIYKVPNISLQSIFAKIAELRSQWVKSWNVLGLLLVTLDIISATGRLCGCGLTLRKRNPPNSSKTRQGVCSPVGLLLD